MKLFSLVLLLAALFGCASSQEKAQKQQMEKEQLQLAIKKIDVACRDKYPVGSPGAMLKRKQCQQMGIESIQLPQK